MVKVPSFPQRPRALLVNGFAGRRLCAATLRTAGCVVRPCRDPERALRLLNRCRFDVVITEMVFANSSWTGDIFIRKLRNHPEHIGTPTIVVSVFAREEDRVSARSAGADLYLVHPLHPVDLLFAVGEVLAARRRGQRVVWNWPELPLIYAGQRRRASDYRTIH
jgi:DNA-binding response OmpR family regulator